MVQWWNKLSTTGKILAVTAAGLITVGLLGAFGVINFGAGDALIGAGGLMNKSINAISEASLAVGQTLKLEENAARAVGGLILSGAGISTGLAVRHKLKQLRDKRQQGNQDGVNHTLDDAMSHHLNKRHSTQRNDANIEQPNHVHMVDDPIYHKKTAISRA
ncbi:MAG: hypothetical protein MK137_03810 [Rickettsiales bacterium]|nr:hypothetical protein [Rickettsiales bacterium]